MPEYRSMRSKFAGRFRMIASGLSARKVAGDIRKQILIGRNSFTVFGGHDDGYFRTLQGQIESFPGLVRYAKRHLRSDSIVFDVGANIGLTTLMLCSLVPEGHVYAFEASPINARYLRMNIAANGFDNCTVLETAIGNQTGELAISISGAGSHIISDAHPFQKQWPSLKVGVMTIDQVVTAKAIDRIDFIKMDIEGFEPMALAGAKDTISKFRPVILMEFNSWSLYFAHKIDPLTFARQIFEQSMVAKIGPDGQLVPILDYTGFLHENMTRNGCVDDIVLTPK